jgi:hypothetical protein
MLILKTLARAPLHGYGVALSIKRLSDDLLNGRRLALSGAPELATAGLGEGGMENDGDKTESPVLYADRSGAQAVGHRRGERQIRYPQRRVPLHSPCF